MAKNNAKYYRTNRGVDQRIDPESRRYFAVSAKRIQQNHHEVKRLLFLGWKNVDIAERLGMTKEMVSFIKNSPVIQAELRKMKGARNSTAISC